MYKTPMAPRKPYTTNMPISYPVPHYKLCQVAKEGVWLGKDAACCLCGAKGTLYFTKRLVPRNVNWPKGEQICVFERVMVPLAECTSCDGKPRVLPEDIPFFKNYCFPVIEKAARSYCQSDKGLRKTVLELGENVPHFTTLHGWLGGLGERALDRVKTKSNSSLPTSVLIAETAKVLNPGVTDPWRCRVKIPEWKCLSPERRELVEACARLLNTASFLFPGELYPLTAWHEYLSRRLHVQAWSFPCRSDNTDFQLWVDGQTLLTSYMGSKPQREERDHDPRAPPDSHLAISTDKYPA